MSKLFRLAREAAILAGSLGTIAVLSVAAGQLQLSSVLGGDLPVRLAVAMGTDALPFLVSVLIICLLGIAAAWRKLPRPWAGVGWLLASAALTYGVYLSRFSMGLLLIPSTVLFAIAGVIALASLTK
jgi:hypothetical protein